MSKLDTNYVINLDLIKDRVNNVMKFGLADVETSDFYLVLQKNGVCVFDKDYTVTLYIVKPNGTFRNIELEPKESLKRYYCNLPDSLKNIPGEYLCQVVVFDNLTSEKKISKSKFKYSVDIDLASEMGGMIDEKEQESILTNILNRLVALENPVEPYATQKHVNECVSTLTEEIDTIKIKDVEQDNRLSSIESKDVEQDDRLNLLESKDLVHESRMTNIESKNVEQDERLSNIETKNTEQDNRLDSIEAIDVTQNNRLDAIETKNQQQDDRLLDIEKVNKRQDLNLKMLFAESKNNMIDIAEEGNSIYLQNSTIGYTLIDEIKGNTLVNCNKEHDKELILNGNINTSGDNNITITEGVDGGLVDVYLEGNTLVNVSKTKDSTAITKAYTVENSGNHIALQGEVDGSCRPVITGNTLVNVAYEPSLATQIQHIDNKYVCNVSTNVDHNGIKWEDRNIFKLNTTYTIIMTIENTHSEAITFVDGYDISGGGWHSVDTVDANSTKTIKFKKTYTDSTSEYNAINFTTQQRGVSFAINDDILILEGDYTNKPIPDYFKGLQSSFEDNLVTQEMVDSGEEVADNLGKYRVEYKTTGKNKFDGQWKMGYIDISTGISNSWSSHLNSDFISVRSNAEYYINKPNDINSVFVVYKYDYNKNYLGHIPIYNKGECFTTTGNTKYVRIACTKDNFTLDNFPNVQLELGNTATEYEPYKESTKTLYLNSPLLKGDNIEEKDSGIYHVHRSEEIVFDGSNDEKIVIYPQREDGFTSFTLDAPEVNFINAGYSDVICDVLPSDRTKNYYDCIQPNIYKWNDATADFVGVLEGNNVDVRQWLQQNPTTIVYQLAQPTYELIEQSNLAIPSYANGHLDLTSAVPVEKAEFKPFSEELTYLYANTQYTVQFISDKAITADITLGGTKLLAQSIVAGLNRVTITTPKTLVDNKLIISGAGANISEVVVTDTNRGFAYFEGMKNVGECEELEVKSCNKNLLDYTQLYDENNFIKTYNGYEFWTYKVKVEKGKTYTISIGATEKITIDGKTPYLCITNHEDYGKTPNEYKLWMNHISIGFNKSVTIPSVDGYLYIQTANNINKIKSLLDNIGYIQIEEGTTATDYIPHQSNTQQLTEPLRAVGDVKDRYVLIDGKWYIERKCGEKVLNGTENWNDNGYGALTVGDAKLFQLNQKLGEINDNEINIVSDVIKGANAITSWNKNEEGISLNKYGYLQLRIPTSKLTEDNVNSLKTWLNSNNIKCIYKLASPTYEPIDYNPLEVYSDTAHISTNSAIPTNITVKNHGFNCLLKPSTTYTISSNLGLNTVTTPSTLTEDCLRFMDTDTSDVTTMRDVLVLEGDWTTKADLIPANFSGIESAFEQEYDTEKGKYKVNIKVANEDKSKENNITFYINEPLRGVGDVKDRIYIKDDKVVVQRNCDIRAYEDGDFGTYLTDKVNTVYQLPESTYEEVEYNDVKLFIESFKNSTLFYNSNVPVTSKLYYSYSVPLVNTVTQTANISDQQDSMIIDMATQVAVMEIMLM